MGRKRGEYYINPDALRKELLIYRDSGNVLITEELGLMLLTLSKRFTGYWQFFRYPEIVKDEMAGEALVRMIEQLGMIDLDHPKCNPFCYLTTIAYNKFVSHCTKYYRMKNTKERLTEMLFDEIEHQEGVQFKRNSDEDDENYK